MADDNNRARSKKEISELFLAKLTARGDIQLDKETLQGIREHFNSLPSRYAYDVNIESLDVLNHKKLLDAARSDPATISFSVRPVNILLPAMGQPISDFNQASPLSPDERTLLGAEASSMQSRGLQVPRGPRGLSSQMGQMALVGSFPRPAFGSSPNLQALAREVERDGEEEVPLLFYEITIASGDRPKLLSQLTKALSDIGLNIREAHAFNTKDGFGLDVFVCDGWSMKASEALEDVLSEKLAQVASYGAAGPPGPEPSGLGGRPSTGGIPVPGESSGVDAAAAAAAARSAPMQIPGGRDAPESVGPPRQEPPDDWELDPAELTILSKIASGSFGDLYRGVYCSQDVAVKILKDVQDNTNQYQEFLQEVSIMRKVRHKNVVQFIGACTRKPNLCIVFEYMAGGSVYDNVRRSGPMPASQVVKVAIEVARGMDYLHQRKIIHRDLKAANLLMDENGVVKIADFGVARVLTTPGVMTAETGTYRWMAPEVIEHKPYNEKADVFSFGILLWELLTGRVPYSDLTPLQAAVGVVHKGLRPVIPESCPPRLAELMRACWRTHSQDRPPFAEVLLLLQRVHQEQQQQIQQQQQAQQQQEAQGGRPSGGDAGRTSIDAKRPNQKSSGFLAKLGIGAGRP